MRPTAINRRAATLALLVAAVLAPAAAQPVAPQPAPPAEVATALPDARWRGAAAMRFFGLHIYDARLWSAAPVAGDGASQPLALELIYARSLVGEQIASRSIKEMKGIGPVSEAQAARWLVLMTQLFPDVKAGDRITGVQAPGQGTRFYFNGSLRGEVADADFTRLFFGIWLSPKTSEPRLRAQLLGSAP